MVYFWESGKGAAFFWQRFYLSNGLELKKTIMLARKVVTRSTAPSSKHQI